MSDTQERIACAAMSNGTVTISMPRPHRHKHVWEQARDLLGPDLQKFTEGYLTNTGTFVDRIEAKKIARAAQQLLRNSRGDDLQSPDIW